jgi:hypothetical protein
MCLASEANIIVKAAAAMKSKNPDRSILSADVVNAENVHEFLPADGSTEKVVNALKSFGFKMRDYKNEALSVSFEGRLELFEQVFQINATIYTDQRYRFHGITTDTFIIPTELENLVEFVCFTKSVVRM